MTSESTEAVAEKPVEKAVATDEPLFNDEELKQFDADDSQAGGAIGKMLTILFLYTIAVMSLAAIWTYYSIH